MNGDLGMLDFYGGLEDGGIPIAYGQVLDPKVKLVRIIGLGFRKDLKPDQGTGGFGIELPRYTVDHKPGYLFDGMKIQFLDKDGHVVRTMSP